MGKATDELLKTHQFVRKILEQFDVREARFPEIRGTLERALIAHAWLQDEILLPALKEQPLIESRFLQQISDEHGDLQYLSKRLLAVPLEAEPEVQALVLQLRTVIQTHFQKEASALYPLAEKVVDEPTLVNLGNEMEQRKTEVRTSLSNPS